MHSGFLALVRRALGGADPSVVRPYLARLPGRLERLAAEAGGRPTGAAGGEERAAVERLLAAIEGDWHDGDENLVRGWLDRWRFDLDRAETARALLGAVAELERIRPGAGHAALLPLGDGVRPGRTRRSA